MTQIEPCQSEMRENAELNLYFRFVKCGRSFPTSTTSRGQFTFRFVELTHHAHLIFDVFPQKKFHLPMALYLLDLNEDEEENKNFCN